MRATLLSAAVVAILASSLAAQVISPAGPAASRPAGAAAEVTYRGKVVDAGGHPVPGAKVICYVWARDPLSRSALKEAGEFTTGEDGKFSFTPKGADQLPDNVVARKDGLSCGWTGWMMPDGDEEPNIILGKPAEVSGVIVDEAGKPVAGATVRPMLALDYQESRRRYLLGREPADWLIVKTDAEGKFRLGGLPADARAEFVVDAPGKARLTTLPLGASSYQYVAGQTGIKLTLKPEGRIEGVLVRKDGTPIAGAVIVAARTLPAGYPDGQFPRSPATTDKDGKFALAGLEEGEYTVELRSAQALPDLVASKGEIAVEFDKTVSGVKVEAIAGGVLQVAVVDAAGKPLPGATVTAMRQSGPTPFEPVASSLTDEKGIARFRVPPGDYLAYVWMSGLRSYPKPEDKITVEDGRTAQAKVEVEAFRKAQGVVRDAAGKPVEGASVRISGSRYPRQDRPAKTDANGRFALAYEMMMPDSSGSSDAALKFMARHEDRGLVGTVEAEEPNKPVEIALKPGAVVMGLVVDEDGKPLPKARVRVDFELYFRLGDNLEVKADAQGRYQVKALPPGRIELTAWAENYGSGNTSVKTEEGKGEVEAEKLTLQAAKLALAGTVTDANAKPLPGAVVYVSGRGQAPSPVTRTDRAGKFKIEKLVEGDVRVRASAPNGLSGSAEAKAGDTDVGIIVHPPNLNPYGAMSRPSPKATSRPAPRGEDF